jgi:hypothetical protein
MKKKDFARALLTFVTTDTLNDQLEPAQADQLYRLGMYLVEFQWPRIKEALEDKPVEPTRRIRAGGKKMTGKLDKCSCNEPDDED